MIERTKLLLIIPLLLIGSKGWAQFVNVNVELDMRRLNEGYYQLFDTIEEDVEEYLLNTQFSTDVNDLEIAIDIRLVLASVTQGGSQTTINAQAIFTNINQDQYFYAKGVQFPYSKGQTIIYTPSLFDPFVSFLNYYAFMFIAMELDTWDLMGGTSFFNRAIELSDSGKDSDWSLGWDDRWKKARKIINNQYLRSMRYNFFMAMEEYKFSEELDVEMIKNSLNTFCEDFINLNEKLGSNKETLQFLKAYHEDIAELLAVFQIKEGLELLILYDHDNKKIYQSYLKK